MSVHLQAKLLRVLQEQKIERIGSNDSISIDVRIIAATNQNLSELTQKNLFREDLFYRLSVIPLKIPALGERRADIPLLVEHLLNKHKYLAKGKNLKLDAQVMNQLINYPWPGNVRELENTIIYMLNFADDKSRSLNEQLLPDTIQEYFRSKASLIDTPPVSVMSEEELRQKEEIERLLICYGSSTEAKKMIAKKLGISLATLYRKIRRHHIPPKNSQP